VTRSDFDGLVCAVLLKDLGIIDDIKFVHPKEMQDGTILISDGDITTNLPYVDGVHLAFDHHHSETIRVSKKTITSSTLTRHRLRGLFMTIAVAKRSSQVSLKI
jgi:hypothetical protein